MVLFAVGLIITYIYLIFGVLLLFVIYGVWLWRSEKKWRKEFNRKCSVELERNKDWNGRFFTHAIWKE